MNPTAEARRLDRLRRLGVLDTPPDPLFDHLTRLAAQICGTPIALISLVDADRQWFKANVGLEDTAQTPREVAFCSHAVEGEGLMEVNDARSDPRFATNPLVQGEPHVVHYAGAPLRMPEGECVGTLCVIDRQPGRLSESQRHQLRELAAAVVEALLMRERLDAELRASEARFRSLSEFAPVGVFHTDAEGACTYTNAYWQRIYGMGGAEAMGDGWSRHLHPDDRERVFAHWSAEACSGRLFDMRFRVRHGDGTVRHVQVRAQPLHGADGQLQGHVGAVEDITERLEAEAQFRLMAEAAPLGLFQARSDGFNLYVNESWAHIFGVPAAHGLGWGWADALPPEERREALARWANFATKRDQRLEVAHRVRRPDGEEREVRTLVQALRDAGGARVGYVGLVIDRTETERAERERAAAEAQLRHAADLAGVGAWRYEVGPPPRLHWSDQTARIHERPAGWQPGLGEAFGYYPPEAQAPLQAAFSRCLQDGTRFALELPMHTASGRRIWVQALGEGVWEDGRVVRLLGIFREVTEQRERESLLRRLYEDTPALLMSFDREGRVLAASSALLALLGQPRAGFVGACWFDRLTSASRAALVRHALPQLWQEGRLERQAGTLQAADGQAVQVLLWATRQDDGNALAVLQDVTEAARRSVELAAEQVMRRQIEAHARDLAELLGERSEMLDVLAHEVRQPLNNASAALQAASRQVEGDIAQALARAQRVLGQVQAGVDNTLAAAELLGGRGEPALVDVELDLLVGIALGDLAADERARVQLQRHTATRTVRADLGLFRLALRNLLINALNWSPPGEGVCVELVDLEEPPAVCVDVVDAGPGIDATVLPRLFQRGAFRSLGGRRGHGLGLYIARSAMERQGGEALLLRTGPSGTAMRLVLPL